MAAAAVAACPGLAGPLTAAPAWPECPVHPRPIAQLSLATKLDTPALAPALAPSCSPPIAHLGAVLAEHRPNLGVDTNLEPGLQRYKRQVWLDGADPGHLTCELSPGASQSTRPKHGRHLARFQWSPIPSAQCPQGSRCKSPFTVFVESLTRLTRQPIDTTLYLVSTLVCLCRQ